MLASAPASGEGATATTARGTAATPRRAAATSGGPTVAASAWASSRSGDRRPPPAPVRRRTTPASRLVRRPIGCDNYCVSTRTRCVFSISFHFPSTLLLSRYRAIA